jgi:hypothetical protein
LVEKAEFAACRIVGQALSPAKPAIVAHALPPAAPALVPTLGNGTLSDTGNCGAGAFEELARISELTAETNSAEMPFPYFLRLAKLAGGLTAHLDVVSAQVG